MDTDEPLELAKKRSFINIFHSPFTAWIILLVSLTLTFAAYHILSNMVTDRAEATFEFRANEIETAITERLRIYEQQLWSGVGLAYSVDTLTRDKFRMFVETMRIDDHWPGIQAYGYSVPLTPEEKPGHIDAVKAEGFPNFSIRPNGERDFYTSILYIEPFDWRNKRAFGYDMWSNEMRRSAMTHARDEGVAAISGIITLVQETSKDIQKGFLMYVPVYATKRLPEEIALRRSEFKGWIYAAFRAQNLMQGILGSKDPTIEFEVFDGDIISKDNLLYDSNDTFHLEDNDHQPDLSKVRQITLQGRDWTLYFATPKDFLSKTEKNQPRLIGLAGGIIHLLLFYVIWSLYFINRAERLAKQMTQQLEASKHALEEQVRERTAALASAEEKLRGQVDSQSDELHEKIRLLEKANDAMVGREKRMIELKKENEELKKRLDSEMDS